MPSMVQACSFNPYYTVMLELLTSLVKRTRGCSERLRSLPTVSADTQLMQELACLIIKPAKFLTDGPRLFPFCYTHRRPYSALSHIIDSDSLRGVEQSPQKAQGWTLYQYLFKGKRLRAYSLELFSQSCSYLHPLLFWMQHPQTNHIKFINPLEEYKRCSLYHGCFPRCGLDLAADVQRCLGSLRGSILVELLWQGSYQPHGGYLNEDLMKQTIWSPVALLTFQILNNYLWLAVAVLDVEDTEHCHCHRKFYWIVLF